MNIERARKLKPGDMVHCPADRGEPAYSGTVKGTAHQTSEPTTINGTAYVWVNVERFNINDATQQTAVWPSNRLG